MSARPSARLAGVMVAVVTEAFSNTARRWRRTCLMALGVVIGVGSFVATMGIASTASAQVSARFDALKATEVTLRREGPPAASGTGFPSDSDERLRVLNGVVTGGRICTVRGGDVDVSMGWTGRRPPSALVAASAGALRAANPTLRVGRALEPVDDDLALPVAVVGSGAAGAAHAGLTAGSVIYLDGIPFTVVGVFDNIERRPDLLASIIVPARSAESLLGASCETPQVLVATAPGAALLVGRQAPAALVPEAIASVSVDVPPDPRSLRQLVEGDIVRLYVVLAVVALVMSGVVIANAATTAVVERTREIGVLRALGATRGYVRAQFIMESAILGGLGGLAGVSLGVLVTGVVTVMNHWVPVMDLRAASLGIPLGAVTGVVGGLVPAHRAARIDAADALRR